MRQVSAVDGFRLAYDRSGRGPAVVLLHGWPGGRGDYRELVPLLAGAADVITPDLRGFGESDQHPADPAAQYSAAAQARSVAGLIGELGLTRPVIVGYDIGSRIAQTLAAERPDLVRALVISPPVPGIGGRILSPDAQREFWYQQFHRLDLATELIDGHPEAVRTYLRYFWEHWSGPDFELPGPAARGPGHGVRAAGGVRGVYWLVPGRGRIRGQIPRRAGARASGPDHRADHRALARARPAVPAGVVGPDRRVLRGRPADPPARGGSFHPAGAPGGVRRRDHRPHLTGPDPSATARRLISPPWTLGLRAGPMPPPLAA